MTALTWKQCRDVIGPRASDRNYPSWRLYCGAEWIGTVWKHVGGFSWAQIPYVPGKKGGTCQSIEHGQALLLAALSA